MGCDFWMDAQREAPERLGKANERISELEAQVSKLEAQLAEAERKAAMWDYVSEDMTSAEIEYAWIAVSHKFEKQEAN